MTGAETLALCAALALAAIGLAMAAGLIVLDGRRYRAPMTDAEARKAIRKINRTGMSEQWRRRWIR